MKTIDALLDKSGTAFSRWQQELIFEQKKHGKPGRHNHAVREQVRSRQNNLESAIAQGHRALGSYLRNVLGLGSGDEIKALLFPREQITSSEFDNPPAELEEELGTAWQDLPPRLASQPLFWLLCHVAWIEEGRFGETGHLLRAALTGGKRSLEARTRNFLRCTGGIFLRGNVSVLSDCRMARAWWRWHVAGQVAQVADGTIGRREAHAALHTNRPAWEELAMLSLRRITVINQPRARAAIVSRLHCQLQDAGRLQKEDVKQIAQQFARLGLRRSLQHTPLEELR